MKVLTYGSSEGELPDWYVAIRAARYLGIPPWELLERADFWLDYAVMSEQAERHASNNRKFLQLE